MEIETKTIQKSEDTLENSGILNVTPISILLLHKSKRDKQGGNLVADTDGEGTVE